MRAKYHKAKAFFNANKKHLLSASFFVGFIIDSLTLSRLDNLLDNLILAAYALLMMGSMLLMYASSAGKVPERFAEFLRSYTPFLVQFALGGLLSGLLVFYTRSGSLTTSWPFYVVMLAVIAGNELFEDRTRRLIFNLSVLFFSLFSYFVMLVPVVTGRMGGVVFVASSLLAVIVFVMFVRLLMRIVPNFVALHMRGIVFSIGMLFVGMHTLYFTNLIPPIPLSLKEIGIYHKVEKLTDGRYSLTYEKPKWTKWYRTSDTTFHASPESKPYCFSAVFAPTRLNVDIYHKWERYDNVSNIWVKQSRIAFPVAGGRDGGYRGYTFIENYVEGKYRCTVETGRGQILGSRTFRVEKGSSRDLIIRAE